MSDLSKPLYALTVGEYIELNRKVFSEEAERLLNNKKIELAPKKTESDIIFIDEVTKLTGCKRATLYSKVCRFEIPVMSRRKPLTFSKKAIIAWINAGKPSVIDQETDDFFKSRS